MIESVRVEVVRGDVSAGFEGLVRDAAIVAWDIETSGLDWQSDRIATCQLNVPGVGTEIIQINGAIPERLAGLLGSEKVTKVFHHAPFDLRFMRYHWSTRPRSIACTKILSKIVHPGLKSKDYSLKPLVERYLGVALDKSQQVSDWLAQDLTHDQLVYAARDVEFLVPLFNYLMDEARSIGVADAAESTFAYLPIRIETDLRGCGDVFAY